MKSNIDSKRVRKLVNAAVEKALIECASQHQVSLDDPGDLIRKKDNFSKYKEQPFQLNLTLTFLFDKTALAPIRNGIIYCQPIIDLIEVKED